MELLSIDEIVRAVHAWLQIIIIATLLLMTSEGVALRKKKQIAPDDSGDNGAGNRMVEPEP